MMHAINKKTAGKVGVCVSVEVQKEFKGLRKGRNPAGDKPCLVLLARELERTVAVKYFMQRRFRLLLTSK